jgi:hypothetical protein
MLLDSKANKMYWKIYSQRQDWIAFEPQKHQENTSEQDLPHRLVLEKWLARNSI